MKRSLKKMLDGGKVPKLKDNIQTNKSDNTRTNYTPVRPRGYTPDSWATNINEIQPNGRVNPNIPGLEDASLDVIDAMTLGAGLLRKPFTYGAKQVGKNLKTVPNFKSEINWAKWNKEIP